MKKGDKIDIRILRIDHDNRRISLGYKQLQDDPWDEIAAKYAAGSECLGRITRVLDRGVTVELDGEVEGFVPTHQLAKPDLTNPGDAFNEGEEIPLKVIEFDRQAHKIVLSVAAYYKSREKAELDQFLAKHPTQTVSMSDSIAEGTGLTVGKEPEQPAQAEKSKPSEPPPATEIQPTDETTGDTEATVTETPSEEKPAEAESGDEKTVENEPDQDATAEIPTEVPIDTPEIPDTPVDSSEPDTKVE
jgi:predicted RNA-binding protein with RPS1 domain